MFDKLLKSALDMCENANKIDYGLHEENKKFNFWFYTCDKLKTGFKIFFRF